MKVIHIGDGISRGPIIRDPELDSAYRIAAENETKPISQLPAYHAVPNLQ
jgi:hypothetical protein